MQPSAVPLPPDLDALLVAVSQLLRKHAHLHLKRLPRRSQAPHLPASDASGYAPADERYEAGRSALAPELDYLHATRARSAYGTAHPVQYLYALRPHPGRKLLTNDNYLVSHVRNSMISISRASRPALARPAGDALYHSHHRRYRVHAPAATLNIQCSSAYVENTRSLRAGETPARGPPRNAAARATGRKVLCRHKTRHPVSARRNCARRGRTYGRNVHSWRTQNCVPVWPTVRAGIPSMPSAPDCAQCPRGSAAWSRSGNVNGARSPR